MLGVATPFQQKTRERIKKYRKKPAVTLKDFTKKKTKKTTKKEKVGVEIYEEDTESLLRLFADEGRILRGRVIKKSELKEVKEEIKIPPNSKYSLFVILFAPTRTLINLHL